MSRSGFITKSTVGRVTRKVLFVTEYMATERHGPSRKAMLLKAEHGKDLSGEIELKFLTNDPQTNDPDCFKANLPPWQLESRFYVYFESFAYYKRLQEVYKIWPFEYVCFNDAQHGLVTVLLNLPSSPKLIAFINDDNSVTKTRRPYDHFTRYLYRRFQRISEVYVAKRVDILISCSSYLSKLIGGSYRLEKAPEVMRPAIDTLEWEVSTNLIRAKNTILFVKSEPRRGGLAVLLEALRNKEVLSKVAHLHLGGFPTEQFHKEFSHLLPPTLKYTIHGHLDRSRLKELVSTCHIGVVPSMYEAYGITAREFLAGGLLTIVSNSGGLPEAVQGSNAEIFEAHNSKELSIKLQHALSKAPQNGVTNLDKYDSGEMYRKFKEIIYSTTNQANLP